jgi:hypothetical protein
MIFLAFLSQIYSGPFLNLHYFMIFGYSINSTELQNYGIRWFD